MAKTLCGNCRKVTDYTLHSRVASHGINGINGMFVQFNEEYATCNECGNETTVPGLEDKNCQELDNVYHGLKGVGIL